MALDKAWLVLCAEAGCLKPRSMFACMPAAMHSQIRPGVRSIVETRFDPDADNSDSGLVARAGAGAFQLRVGQPPGSQEPLVWRP